MIIQNHVSGASPAYLPPVTTQPVQEGSAKALAPSAHSVISYEPSHAVSKLSAPDEGRSLSASLRPGEQAGSANGATLQAALTKIAQLLRDIFQHLFSPWQSTPQSPAQQSGQQTAGNPFSSTAQPALRSGVAPSEGVQNKFSDPHLASDHSAGGAVKTATPAASSPDGVAAQPTVTSAPGISSVPETSSPPVEYGAAKNPAPQPAAQTTVKGSSADALAGITGYAKAAHTTGGSGGKVVTVSTVAELEKSLTGDEPTSIKLAKSLSASDKTVIKFGANKTLEGTSQGMGLHNIYLASDKTAGNDVFRNLDFTHDARYRANGDIPLFISNGQGYFIDHNTFSGTREKEATGLDKLLYVGGTADNVTLSNSLFKDNEYGAIFGQPDDTDAAAQKYGGYPRMTIANNRFNNIDVRSPGLMREGKFDVYNNLIDNFNLGFTLAKNATVFSQANYFENGYDMHHRASNTGTLNDYGNAKGFTDVGSNVSFAQTTKGTAAAPVEYSRVVKTAEEAKVYNLAHAGAGK